MFFNSINFAIFFPIIFIIYWSLKNKPLIYQNIFIPINLNTASRENILLIPGVGRRMAHEFEEYRPYSNLEQFRREIGKYVNEQEVLRLQMYVTLD